MASTLYFAFGSNLLAARIRIRNESAVRKGIARLDDYRLDFNRKSVDWGGCSATIVKQAGKHVWGALWEISTSEIEALDEQEGVHQNIYRPLTVNVTTPDGEVCPARTYQMVDEPKGSYESPSLLPLERSPSRIYLEVILQGALESGLPTDYFEMLKSFPHNGYSRAPFGINVEQFITQE